MEFTPLLAPLSVIHFLKVTKETIRPDPGKFVDSMVPEGMTLMTAGT